ncbi:MAG: ABC transporter substrate-binding protein [Dehalococcoidales bacterium]|nr:ABC transporter substrate-binding protein [Dehalococcoidales bacterium]
MTGKRMRAVCVGCILLAALISACAPAAAPGTPPATPTVGTTPAAAAQPAAAVKKPIKLGAVIPLGDITGAQSAKAMKLAVKEINAKGGVLGRPLELIVVDDEMKPDKGAAALDKLATVDKVDVFIGGMASGVLLGQAPTLKKYAKVTVWTGAASSKCEEAIGADADWFFHIHPWDYNQGASYEEGWTAITKRYPQIKVENQFWAYEEGAFGAGTFKASQDLYNQWAKIQGQSFKSAAVGGGDYRAVLRQAKEAKPDVFIWVGYEPDAMGFVQQAKEIGFAPPIFLGSPPGWPVAFGKSPLSEAVWLYGMWAPAIKEVSDVSKGFLDAYVKEYGEEPATYFSPLGYANVYIVAEAIRRAGTIDKPALIAALERTEYKSPTGDVVTFTPSKIIKHQGIKKQKILQYQHGQQQVIWPFEVATAKPAYPFPSWEGR